MNNIRLRWSSAPVPSSHSIVLTMILEQVTMNTRVETSNCFTADRIEAGGNTEPEFHVKRTKRKA
ncbi:hypothetical protein H9L39_15670 [Fusarium oxysporum f. sp. albedinis]|nr:hypothetical protein H9L39_15670 [Fusarium oxysporum f. sp. albedinis]